jgi:prevent-host-death family protein
MHGHWQLDEAKQRFSELIRSVEADGPQFLTRHGEEVAVVVSIAEYSHLRNTGRDFKAFLQSPPDIDMEISRSVLPARRVEVLIDAGIRLLVSALRRHASTNAGEAGRPGS